MLLLGSSLQSFPTSIPGSTRGHCGIWATLASSSSSRRRLRGPEPPCQAGKVMREVLREPVTPTFERQLHKFLGNQTLAGIPASGMGQAAAPSARLGSREVNWACEQLKTLKSRLQTGLSSALATLFDYKVSVVLTADDFTAEHSDMQMIAINAFETIYDFRPTSTCISIYLVSLIYTLFFQNHKHSCWNFMWKCLRGWKLTPLWAEQSHSCCWTKASL